MSTIQSGDRNPNWRGGRTITSHGYVLIRVGKDHPLADCRGYAYEHRLKASEKLGRLVKPSEVVHHDNEGKIPDKADNRPENLKVCSSQAEHRSHHRKAGSKLRLPDETNPLISCSCGCGGRFEKYDANGRPRQFIPGHNPQPSPTKDKILHALSGRRALRLGDILVLTGLEVHATKVALSKMKTSGLVENPSLGYWRRIK